LAWKIILKRCHSPMVFPFNVAHRRSGAACAQG
jgi:hypothetical protein